MKFDDILVEVGEFGRYQRRLYILTCLVIIPCAFHGLGQVGVDVWPNILT